MISSYEDLKQYILRRLGAPVINIEIEETQLQDRIDDAVQFFVERHHEGLYEKIVRIDFTEADEATQSFPMPEGMVHIKEIFNLSEGSGSSEEFERINYLLSQSDWFQMSTKNGTSHNLNNYQITMQYVSLLRRFFNKKINFQLDKYSKLVKVPSHKILKTNFIILVGYFARNPQYSPELYDERWIRDYATALAKRQWGTNLKKYDGVQMAGGVTVQGQKIWDEADEEVKRLEEQFADKYQLPIGIFMG